VAEALHWNGLADLVRDEVQPDLLQKGFVRKGLLFSRQLEEVWHFVGFQKSRSSDTFTVNLGVASKRILRFLEGPAKPSFDDCHWNERLGFLSPQRDDLWWTLSDPASMAEALLLLKMHGLPSLEALSSDLALRDLWLTGQSPGLTEMQRLVCLSTLLASLGPADQLALVKQEMQDMAANRPAPAIVRQLQMLDRS
jgi:hypothetical protein